MDVLTTLPRLFSLLGWGVILGGAVVTGGGFWFVFVYEPSWGAWWLGLLWIIACVFVTVFVYAWILLGALAAEHFLSRRIAQEEPILDDDTVVTPARHHGGDDALPAL